LNYQLSSLLLNYLHIPLIPLFVTLLVFGLFCIWRDSPPMGQGLQIHEVSRSHSTTHQSRWDSSGRVIRSSQKFC